YFMNGLPCETDEDIVGIAQLAGQVVNRYFATPNRAKGKGGLNVSVSVSCFVPKPHNPFQWEPQDTMEELERKQRLLVENVYSKKISLSWHDAATSFLEGVLARGDRRLGAALEEGFRRGFNLDSWSEHFSLEGWLSVFADCGIDPAFYANRRRSYEEILPWDHLDYGVTKQFFIRENELAKAAATTPNCREKCAGCGAACWKRGVCVE
ncbi:MAG: B12-binding domain-containing radical SAM protein, partial [Clostridia bacterium]|nr:B12-binding domain-containing radical SAM protein [Clostridia bacterium]